MNRIFILLSLLAGLAIANNSAAIDWTLLTHPDLIDEAPGADGFWGTGDDAATPAGYNPVGAASAGIDSFGGFSFVAGTLQTNSSAVQTLGVNMLTGASLAGLYTIPNFFGPGVDFQQGFSQTYDPGGANTSTVQANNTFTTSYWLAQSAPSGTAVFAAAGAGWWIWPTDDYATLFAGIPNLVTHFDTIIPLLPLNWTGLAVSFDGYSLVSNTPATGFDPLPNDYGAGYSITFYTTDPNAQLVPIPAMLPAFLFALGGLWRYRQRSA